MSEDLKQDPNDGDLIATPTKLVLEATVTRADGTVEIIELEDLNVTETEPSEEVRK